MAADGQQAPPDPLQQAPLGPLPPAPDWQDRLVNYFNRAEDRFTLEDEAAKVTPCDGGVPEAVSEFLKQMELVDPPQRHAVFNRAARGSLLRTGLQWFEDHHGNAQWIDFRNHLMRSFVTADVALAQQRELRSCQRMPGEAVLSYNRRFKEIADDAYPLPRNEEQTTILIQAYARGLKDDRLREKIVTPNRPDTLQIAMQRVQALEAKAENLAWIGVFHEPMDVDMLATRPKETPPKTPKKPDMKPPPTQVDKEIHHLKTQYGKLENKVDRLLQGQLQTQESWAPPRDIQRQRPQGETRTCYYCGRVGHLERYCRQKKKHEKDGSQKIAATHPKSA